MTGEPDYDTIEIEVNDTIRIVRLNRPERLNAINPELKGELGDALDRLEADESVRVVILAGNGRAFSSGADLNRIGDPTRRTTVMDARSRLESTERIARRIWTFQKPIIAAVHGYCLGVACELAMLCDLTIASEECRLGEPEIRFGSGSPILIMPWLITMKAAKELLLSGSMISATRACELGIVNEVAPEGRLMECALRKARLLSRVSPHALSLTKQGINRTYEAMGLETALAYHTNLAAMIDGVVTPESEAFAEIVRRDGVRAALDWRDRQFKEIEDDV